MNGPATQVYVPVSSLAKPAIVSVVLNGEEDSVYMRSVTAKLTVIFVWLLHMTDWQHLVLFLQEKILQMSKDILIL